MNTKFSALVFLALFAAFCAGAYGQFDKDVIKTNQGDLHIGFLGHGSLMFTLNDISVFVDPLSRMTDYDALPKADLVLITHEHGDHLDPKAVARVRKDGTTIIAPEKCAGALEGCVVMRNGETSTAAGLTIEAVPAYNVVQLNQEGRPFHPQGEGNGYIITFGDTRVYVAGDTENIPEMKPLKNISVAFLPMNLPFTMTPEMVADAARAFRPAILYPYHYGNSATGRLVELLKDEKDIEVRVKNIYPPPAKKNS